MAFVCYIGDKLPTSFGKNEMVEVPEISYDEGTGEFFVSSHKRNFHEIMAKVKSKRNGSILKALQAANSWYENDHQRHFVNDTHRDLARLALDEGLIPELPRWVMQANISDQKQPDPCPVCMTVPKAGAILCINCSQVFNVLEAFKLGRVKYDSVDMERLTKDEWEDRQRAARSAAEGKRQVSWTLAQVKARVRTLLDDPQGSWVTDSFIVPEINQVYEDCNSQLESTQSSWDIALVEVPNVQPGTPNLELYQLGNGPLSNLTDQPLRIDWKPAGNDPSYYQLVPNFEVLPDLQPQQSMHGWEYRSEVIWLTPCSIAVDPSGARRVWTTCTE